ncbi:MFS transporter [Amycolatopsis suaedae]|uniref:MFS transporter n=1 Tax=Amycolatopsis suaedae TaxID=2510978 RepID=A0A4V2EKW8_9PSEU|nr:MFS transporter [Amycolatopsis suaedae]RZQ59515.1 MFS transporter [Amycolatopsis suaedae]
MQSTNPARVLASAQLISSVGDGAYYVSSALYFTLVVGLSPAQVGLGLTVSWAVGSVAGVALGHLADRRGPRGTAVLLALGTAASVTAFLFVGSVVAFVIAACAYACFQCGLGAARQALLAGLIDPAERTTFRARLQAMSNAGIAVGAALGGIALAVGTREAYLAVFVVDALGFVAAAAVLRGAPEVRTARVRSGEPSMAVLRDRPYALLALLNMIMLLYMPLFSLVIPLWISTRTAAPTWLVSAMLVLNTASVVIFQVRVARGVRSLGAASRYARHAGLLLFVSCLVFAFSALSESAWLAALVLLAGAALQVVGEMAQAAGSWEIGFGLAPDGKQGQYQGLFGAGTAIARMLGPVLLTGLILTGGMVGWVVLGGLFLLAGVLTAPAVRWAERNRRPAMAAGRYCDPTATVRQCVVPRGDDTGGRVPVASDETGHLTDVVTCGRSAG